MDTGAYARADCKLCAGKGRVRVGERINDVAICPCVLAHQKRLAARRIIHTHIGARGKDMTLDRYQTGGVAANGKALGIARNFVTHYELAAREGWLLTFWGPPGCGKTHLAVGIARECVLEYLARPRIWNIPTELRRERERFSRDDPGPSPVTQAMESELLVLDDLGAEYHRAGAGSGGEVSWLYETLYGILEERIMSCRPTLVTSNCGPAELRRRLNTPAAMRVLSRIERAAAAPPIKLVPVQAAAQPNRSATDLLLAGLAEEGDED